MFVLADDLGWAELGCYGNGFNETPHLDRLAEQGMRFTQAYAAAPVCSPYRAALLTGQHPARVGILDYLRPNSANSLSTSQMTLPEMLNKGGYATGMVGKWHLTGYKHHDAEFEVTPSDHGFDWDFGREIKGVGNGANFWPYMFRDQGIRWTDIPENRLGDNEYLTDRLNVEAVDFVERNKDRPFFLYVSHYAPHTILNGRPDLVEKYRAKHAPGKSTREKCYLCEDSGLKGESGNHWAGDHNPHLAAMLESIDDGIGLLTQRLDELGLAENTILIFSSDNGGETNVTSNAPLRGGKSQLYEGGVRVPLIVRWPRRIAAATTCNQPTVNYDFYPTLLEAAGIEPDPAQTLDGVSTLATWNDSSHPTGRDAIYWHYPLDQPHFLGGVSAGAIRAGDWKLVERFEESGDARFELFDLANDPSEANNIAIRHADRVSALTSKLVSWRERVGARVPSPPLLVSPRQLYFGDHFSDGLVSERWFFQKEWTVEDGALRRNENAGNNKRIFVKDPQYRDVMIRFDFRFEGAEDIRLVTGSSGHYNAVIHIHRDHFYIQTALDNRGPFFPYRHGECEYDFRPGQWYTMTVEFAGDELVTHLDHDHLAYAHHPILDQQRTYFAFQVDQPAAAFDNVQIFRAAKNRDAASNFNKIERASDKYPVAKPLQEQYAIQKTNAHEWLYQRDEDYRSLVARVDLQKQKEKEAYPEVFESVKEYRKKIDTLRRTLHAEDPDYKETLFATYRAARAIDAFLVAREPAVEDLPASQQPAALERLRKKYGKDTRFIELVAVRVAAQKTLESRYPQLFVTNEQIVREKKERRRAIQDNPTFIQLIQETAAAWRAQQSHLHENDELLAELQRRLESQEK
ncbi:MAG: sulfatase-like hydrolase/transferase [Planctomycetes bacterium]|nr:sulfatase-like hydrolase/transferase [Planctomycetota bacterium]